jgi:thymidine kinase
MFSGKTTELIARLAHAAGAGARVVALKPLRDNRYAQSELVTHAGLRLGAGAVASALDIAGSATGFEVVGIDEAHFFGASLVAPCMELVRQGVRVIVAGVERDHKGRPFEPFPALLCEADEVVKLSGPCARCGAPAVHSQRMTGGDEAIVVGGAEMYEARCRGCFGLP